jgi:hypothetical protein
MTITLTKTKLAIALLAVVLLVPATAYATHTFSDVPDGKFYTDAVEWAFDNGITTGTSATTFEPDANVTRGQNVTFAKRYDDNIVQPALTSLTAAQAFAATASETDFVTLTGTPTAYVTVSVTAPVAGHVTVNSTAVVTHTVDHGDVLCEIVESTDIPGSISSSDESAQWHEAGGAGGSAGSLSGTRTFDIAAGASIDYVLACEETADGGSVFARNLTAIFTPAP